MAGTHRLPRRSRAGTSDIEAWPVKPTCCKPDTIIEIAITQIVSFERQPEVGFNATTITLVLETNDLKTPSGQQA
jgi:hypothetical protein